jgi:hypothetical protein
MRAVCSITLAAALCFSGTAISGADRQAARLPTVIAAAMPAYTGIALNARVRGRVRIQVYTDGEQVQLTVVQDGPRLLRDIAQANLKTWRFAPHQPTSFEVTFDFNAVNKSHPDPCGPGRKAPWLGPDAVTSLDFPTAVRIEAVGEMAAFCDPTATVFEGSVSRIRGVVVCDCEGRRPVADAQVVVEEWGHEQHRTRTDGDGRFSFGSVGWGWKHLIVHKEGYFSRYYEVKSTPLPWIKPSNFELELVPDPAQLQPEPRTKASLIPTTVPLYPAAARDGNVEGEVRVGLAPDGQLTTVTGPADLVRPTLEAARTWKVVKGDDPSELRFTYKLIAGDCSGGGPAVRVAGAYDFEVTAKRVVRCGAD